MTVTSDFMTNPTIYRVSNGALEGGHLVSRFLQRLVGVSFIAAASGIWLAPGADWSSDMMLMKIGLSAVSLLTGFWLVFMGADQPRTEVEMDLQRNELRILRPGAMGAMLVVRHCPFAQFGRVVQSGRQLRFFDAHGDFLADVKVTDRDILQKLVFDLRQGGQIV